MVEKARKNYLRVTTILEKYTDYQWCTEEDKNKGLRFHAFCEAYGKGLFCSPEKDIKLICDSFMRWFDLAIEKVIFTERRFYCDVLEITGKPDCVAQIKNDQLPILLDWKPRITKGYIAQVNVYKYLIEASGFVIGRCAIFVPDKKGEIGKIKDCKDPSALSAFFNALNAQRYFNS